MTAARLDPELRDRWFIAAFAILAVATCVPIWIARYLPLLDEPNHLSAVAVWHYLKDPSWNFDQYYSLNLVPLPYWFHYYTVHLLTYVTHSVEVANKLFLTAYVLAVPSGALLFARQFGRSHWLSLFTFPLAWNFGLSDGFIAFCAGLATVPFALVLVDRHATHPTPWRALWVLVVGSSLYLFHLLPYALFLVCGSLLVLAQPRPFRPASLLVRGLPVVACSVVGLVAMRSANNMHFHGLKGGRQFNYEVWQVLFGTIADRMINFLSGSADEWVLVTLATSWLLLAVTAARVAESDDPEGNGLRLHSFGVELCLLGALALFLGAPRTMHQPFYWYMIAGRFAVAIGFFGALTVRYRIAGWRRLLLAPVVVAGVVYSIALSRAFVEFNRHAAGFDSIVARIPRDKQVLTLMMPPHTDSTVNANVYIQWPSYVQLRHGGYNFYNFSEGFPLKYKRHLPAPPWNRPQDFRWEMHSAGWSYFLTFREGWEVAPLQAPLAQGKVRLIAQEGQWRLYENVVPTKPD
jgi:hypothetical protein